MDPYRRAILRWSQARTPFTLIEDRINALDLNDEQKAALWLYAWALRGQREQMAEAKAFMQMTE